MLRKTHLSILQLRTSNNVPQEGLENSVKSVNYHVNFLTLSYIIFHRKGLKNLNSQKNLLKRMKIAYKLYCSIRRNGKFQHYCFPCASLEREKFKLSNAMKNIFLVFLYAVSISKIIIGKLKLKAKDESASILYL